MFRTVPRSVVAYTVLVVALWCIRIPRAHALWHRPVEVALVSLIALAFLSALVVFRQRWAWWIAVIGGGAALVSPVWTSIKTDTYVGNLVQVALLLSPSMRAWVRLRRPKPAFG